MSFFQNLLKFIFTTLMPRNIWTFNDLQKIVIIFKITTLYGLFSVLSFVNIQIFSADLNASGIAALI